MTTDAERSPALAALNTAPPALPMDETQFANLFTRMRDPVFNFAARRLSPDQAKDVVGETFEVAWRKRDHAPPDPTQWPAWVIGIARNKVLQEIQRVALASTTTTASPPTQSNISPTAPLTPSLMV